MKKKLIILSGPSCVGKTPLLKTMAAVFPKIQYGRLILYNSRPPRPIETEGVDYYFRSETEIRHLDDKRYLVSKVRKLWQAVDLHEVEQVMSRESLVILEIYPTIGKKFLEHPLTTKLLTQFEIRTVFISPMTFDEIKQLEKFAGLGTPEEIVASIMLPKLISRSQQMGKLLSTTEIEDLQLRASMAYEEMLLSKDYTDVIINHDGEDSQHWKCLPPIGDAGKTLQKFVDIILE